MSQNNRELEQFLYPSTPYRGEFTPEKLLFHANLQQFARQVEYLCALETGGNITAEAAFQQMNHLWKDLKHSRQALGWQGED